MENRREKKFQCFISSTYDDLRLERAECMNAILNAGHIPAGMEYFEAGKPQKEIIEKWMDESDIIIFLVGGRYGSIDTVTGKGYVEDEYDYAEEKHIEFFTICLSESFIMEKAAECKKQNLAMSVTETENKDKYDAFKKKISKIECTEVSSLKEIESAVIKNIYARANIKGGWIKYSDSLFDVLSGNIVNLSTDSKNLLFKRILEEKMLVQKTGSQELANTFNDTIDQYIQTIEKYITTMSRSIKLTLYDDYIEVTNTVNVTYRVNGRDRFKYNPWMYEGLESETFNLIEIKYNGRKVNNRHIKSGTIKYTSNPFYVTNVIRVDFPFSENKKDHNIKYKVTYRTNYARYFHEYVFKEFCQYFSLNVSLDDKRINKMGKEYMIKWGMFTPYKIYDHSSQNMLRHEKNAVEFNVSNLMLPGNGYVITLNAAPMGAIREKKQ